MDNKLLQLPDLADGELFAGMMLDAEGMPSHYLILLPGDVEMPWQEAMDWAKKIGGDLPTRAEQAQLFANRQSAFEDRYYWSNTQHVGDAGCAWLQGFASGFQDNVLKSNSFRARAVRRVVIEVLK